jgi:hypothetical protein
MWNACGHQTSGLCTLRTRRKGSLLALTAFALACSDSTDPNFDPTEITVEVSGSGNGSGRVTGPTATGLNCGITQFGDFGCRSTFTDAGAGGVFALDAVPDSVSRFVQWGGDCTGLTCTLSFPQGRDTTFKVIVRFLLLPPSLTIESPVDGTSLAGGTRIQFTGRAMDARGQLLTTTYVWTSSRDGQLCSAANPPDNCATFGRVLSPGEHLITLTAPDTEGTTATSSVRITVRDSVNAPPEVEITTPSDGASLPGDQPARLAGFARDPEDGVLPDSVHKWTSSRDGAIGVGFNLSRILSVGSHVIRLMATDSRGAIGTDSVRITVFTPSGGPASISGRVTGNGYAVGGALLRLAGAASATTVTDGNGNYSFPGLTAGTYTVTVTVDLNISFPAPSQTVTLAAGQSLVVNFVGTY